MPGKYSNIFYQLYNEIAKIPSKISWGKPKVSKEELEEVAAHLASGYYIILTGSRSHLSSVIVSLLSWIKTGKWAKYTHVLMNCDNITDPSDTRSFKFMEATARGVHYSTFDEVFKCDYVCLLTPKTVSNYEWTQIIDALLVQEGRPYDDLFDLSDSSHVSCVELVLDALKASNYTEDFANLDAMIRKEKNLVPQMYRDCPDFTVKVEFK